MTSKDIYTPILFSDEDKTMLPTVLYIKRHSITKKKYYGKTTQEPYKYLGSGVKWKLHFTKHGKQYIETIFVSKPYTDKNLIQVDALDFSFTNNIVESDDWSNLIPENGLDGGYVSHNNTLSKETCLSKYGYENPFQVPSIKEKFQNEMLINTGYYNPSKDPIVKKLKTETCFSNYGVEYPQQSIIIQEQTKETCLSKYGVEFTLQIPEIRQKGKETCLEKYGVENPSQAQEIKDKKIATNLKNRGVENPAKSKEVIEKSRQTRANTPPTICPHCSKSCKGGNVTRHHFNNCKLKPI